VSQSESVHNIMEEIVVTAEETVATQPIYMDGLQLFFEQTGTEIQYSNEILVQESPTLELDVDSIEVSEDKSDRNCAVQKSSRSPITYTEKFRGRPPKFEASEVDSQGQVWYECTVCHIKYSGRCELLQHMRTHDKERPFFCKICGSNFKQVVHLRAHMRMHTGEKPFKCSVCARNFRQKAILDQHMRTHTQDKPYKCTETGCNKEFTQKTSLKNHQRSHRSGKLSELYGRKDLPNPPPILRPNQDKSRKRSAAAQKGSLRKKTTSDIEKAIHLPPLLASVSNITGITTLLDNTTRNGISTSAVTPVSHLITTTSGSGSSTSNAPLTVQSTASKPVTTTTKIIDNRTETAKRDGKFLTTVVRMTPTQFQEYLSRKYPKLKGKNAPLENSSPVSSPAVIPTLSCQQLNGKTVTVTEAATTRLESTVTATTPNSLDIQHILEETPVPALHQLQVSKSCEFPSVDKTASLDRDEVHGDGISGTGQVETKDGVEVAMEKQKQVTGSFLAYVNLCRPLLQAEEPELTRIEVVEELAKRWNRLKGEEKTKFADLAKQSEYKQQYEMRGSPAAVLNVEEQQGTMQPVLPARPDTGRQKPCIALVSQTCQPDQSANSNTRLHAKMKAHTAPKSKDSTKTTTIGSTSSSSSSLFDLEAMAGSVFGREGDERGGKEGEGGLDDQQSNNNSQNQVVLKQLPHRNGEVYEVAMERVNIDGPAPGEKNNIVVISPVRKLRTYPSPKRPRPPANNKQRHDTPYAAGTSGCNSSKLLRSLDLSISPSTLASPFVDVITSGQLASSTNAVQDSLHQLPPGLTNELQDRLLSPPTAADLSTNGIAFITALPSKSELQHQQKVDSLIVCSRGDGGTPTDTLPILGQTTGGGERENASMAGVMHQLNGEGSNGRNVVDELGERADISNDENLNEMASVAVAGELSEEEVGVAVGGGVGDAGVTTAGVGTSRISGTGQIVESNLSFVIEDSGELHVLEESGILCSESYADPIQFDVQDNIENLYSIYEI